LALVREFLRVLGLHPVVLGRGEVVTARSGVGLLQEILVSLLRHEAEAGARSGALHLSRVLPAGTMADLRRLPPVSADRRSCIDGALAVTELAMPVALRLLGEEFPEPMAHACAAYWQRELGVVPVGLRSPGGSPSTD